MKGPSAPDGQQGGSRTTSRVYVHRRRRRSVGSTSFEAVGVKDRCAFEEESGTAPTALARHFRHPWGVAIHIRDYGAADHNAVVEPSLRAWTPVFASMEAVLGAELAARLHGEDWRVHQARSVSETLAA